MARKLRIGVVPTGVPKHIVRINNRNVGLDEDYASIKTYGRSVFINERYVGDASSDRIRIRLPRSVRVGRVKATHGTWVEVSYL